MTERELTMRTNHTMFNTGDAIVIAEGPHKYVRGAFLALKHDVEWASVKEPNGAVSSHPVKWMRSDRELVHLNPLEQTTEKE